ncbi:MAG TPA: tetratricopeptide repeat protein [Spirochaetota bacterium]|nr:tetratricopeptide repeat protein [Spirochaetota bacterium]HPC40395.1 tetratricopeptide repeat protein [Spirochaetota bacterium]HPL17323.1 tetratricopeptide repeat protein [Spirochaetota bacterium]HQF07694.1 tetratricopeptide repeat protein [Spirochaetota bacterium]HQH96426.1 tetratricopeptide repeat protein [Spirochaetota bacterium]
MKRIAALTSIMFLFAVPARTAMLADNGGLRLKVFVSMTDREGWYAVQIGKIVSFSSKDEYSKTDLFEKARDKSKATVRLYDAEGINDGDTFYVINEKNLITAKMTVRTVFNSASFGPMLVGYGNFRLSSVGDRVIQRAEDEKSRYAYVYKARGDYYENIGSRGEAVREYKNALSADKKNPGAHLALGLIYMNQGLDQYAIREFQEAHKNIKRLYDNEDKFLLLESIADINYRLVYESSIPAKLKDKYRDDGMKACREALAIYPKSEKMFFYLAVFNYRNADPDDKTAKDCLLKAIELNPSYTKAYIALSELYYRHDNMEKARMYAEKAIGLDSTSKGAQKMLKYIESKERIRE